MRIPADLDEFAVVRSKALDCGSQLAVIGILPTLDRQHLVVDSLTREERYELLNEQMLSDSIEKAAQVAS